MSKTPAVIHFSSTLAGNTANYSDVDVLVRLDSGEEYLFTVSRDNRSGILFTPNHDFVRYAATPGLDYVDFTGEVPAIASNKFAELRAAAAALMPSVLDVVVDSVVEELCNGWPVLHDKAIVAAFKDLVNRRFTATANTQEAFEAILNFIEGQVMEGIEVTEIQAQIQNHESGSHNPAPIAI